MRARKGDVPKPPMIKTAGLSDLSDIVAVVVQSEGSSLVFRDGQGGDDDAEKEMECLRRRAYLC